MTLPQILTFSQVMARYGLSRSSAFRALRRLGARPIAKGKWIIPPEVSRALAIASLEKISSLPPDMRASALRALGVSIDAGFSESERALTDDGAMQHGEGGRGGHRGPDLRRASPTCKKEGDKGGVSG